MPTKYRFLVIIPLVDLLRPAYRGYGNVPEEKVIFELIASTLVVGYGLGLGQCSPKGRMVAHYAVNKLLIRLIHQFVRLVVVALVAAGVGWVSAVSAAGRPLHLTADDRGQGDELVPATGVSWMPRRRSGRRRGIHSLLAVALEVVQLIAAGVERRLGRHEIDLRVGQWKRQRNKGGKWKNVLRMSEASLCLVDRCPFFICGNG